MNNENDEMQREYRFDYAKGVRGKYAGRIQKDTEPVLIDKDIIEFFQTPEALNMALRHLIAAVPRYPEQPAG
jgi:hypothetical protein